MMMKQMIIEALLITLPINIDRQMPTNGQTCEKDRQTDRQTNRML